MFTCIKNGIDLEQRDKNWYKYTGLIHAIKKGNKSVVDILIDFKVNINATDLNQKTALIHASLKGRLEIV